VSCSHTQRVTVTSYPQFMHRPPAAGGCQQGSHKDTSRRTSQAHSRPQAQRCRTREGVEDLARPALSLEALKGSAGHVASTEDTRLTAGRLDAHRKCALAHTATVQPQKRNPGKQHLCHLMLGQPCQPPPSARARALLYMGIPQNCWENGEDSLSFCLAGVDRGVDKDSSCSPCGTGGPAQPSP